MKKNLQKLINQVLFVGFLFVLPVVSKAHGDLNAKVAAPAANYISLPADPLAGTIANTGMRIYRGENASIINCMVNQNEESSIQAVVVDKKGKVVATKNVKAGDLNVITFDMSNHKPGKYTIKVVHNALEEVADFTVVK